MSAGIPGGKAGNVGTGEGGGGGGHGSTGGVGNSGQAGGTAFGDNFAEGEVEGVWAEWDASGYLTRVAGPGMDVDWMAEAIVFAISRPRGQMIDVIHVRSFAPGHDTDQREIGS